MELWILSARGTLKSGLGESQTPKNLCATAITSWSISTTCGTGRTGCDGHVRSAHHLHARGEVSVQKHGKPAAAQPHHHDLPR